MAASGFGQAVEPALLDLVLRGTAYAIAPGTRLSLHTGDPGPNGLLLEVVGGSYARQPCAWDAAVGNAVNGGSSNLSVAVTFVAMPACTVTHFGVWTAGGAFIGYGDLNDRAVYSGEDVRLTTDVQFKLKRAA